MEFVGFRVGKSGKLGSERGLARGTVAECLDAGGDFLPDDAFNNRESADDQIVS